MSNKLQLPAAEIYHIRFQGKLDEKWTSWFEGFTMTSRENGESLLSGPVIDQAELFGILGKINNLGLPLLMVMRVDCPCTEKKCARHGLCQACAAHYENKGTMPFCLRGKTKWDRLCSRLLEHKEK